MKKADNRREMAQETKQTQAPVLCATGCGFYGNPRTNGMCSVCYKDSAPRQNSTARVGLSESDGCSVAVESSTVAVSSALSLVASSMEQSSQSTEEVDFQTVGTGVQTEPQGSALDDSDLACDHSPGKHKQKTARCFTCHKKVGLTAGFDCRCGNVFCGTHRYSDIHKCSFDYRAEAAEKIRKENPVVVGEKINKI
ncbi:AN1-type zinc finger protein 6-like isoform X5 [Conger conger]|uniref:AN1-type zinc finger protein 6-like isoform X5 n=1 Tax=Conger conger TaxID=82655 RepID=UPI002A5A0CB9|nr:AN1-type zinc finger protein 6-like isoform X5 [Conger conger]